MLKWWVLLGSTLALTGCVIDDASPELAPAVSNQSVASVSAKQHSGSLAGESVSERALRVISDYFQLTDELTSAAESSAEALRPLVSATWYPHEVEGLRSLSEDNLRTIGSTDFDHVAIQSARVSVEGDVEVAVFMCVDTTGVWVIDADAPEAPEDLEQWLLEGADPELIPEDQAEAWQSYLDQVRPVAGVREPVVVWLRGADVAELVIDRTESWRGHHPCEQEP